MIYIAPIYRIDFALIFGKWREGPHGGAREPHALHDGPVVQLVAEHQHAAAAGLCLKERREDRGVRGEAHAQHQRVLDFVIC